MQSFPVVSNRSAWLGSELAHDKSWIYPFSQRDLDELDAAMRRFMSRNVDLEKMQREDFSLPTLGPKLLDYLAEIRDGRGFVLLRGLPVERYSDAEAAVIYWGIGTHLGTAVLQNVGGDLLGHVSDFGKKWGELGVRGYETNGELIFHTDFSDMVGLLCLRRSKSGGFSRLASSITVHNELRANHPELLPPLYRGFRYIKREAVESDRPVTENVPVFAFRDGLLSCRIVRERIDSAYKRIGQPLSELETKALNTFAAIAGSERVCLNMDFQAGDMQFLNNYTILHSRTSYVDGDTPELKRHLLRLWLSMRGERRPLAANFPQANGYGLPGMTPPVGAVELGLAGR